MIQATPATRPRGPSARHPRRRRDPADHPRRRRDPADHPRRRRDHNEGSLHRPPGPVACATTASHSSSDKKLSMSAMAAFGNASGRNKLVTCLDRSVPGTSAGGPSEPQSAASAAGSQTHSVLSAGSCGVQSVCLAHVACGLEVAVASRSDARARSPPTIHAAAPRGGAATPRADDDPPPRSISTRRPAAGARPRAPTTIRPLGLYPRPLRATNNGDERERETPRPRVALVVAPRARRLARAGDGVLQPDCVVGRLLEEARPFGGRARGLEVHGPPRLLKRASELDEVLAVRRLGLGIRRRVWREVDGRLEKMRFELQLRAFRGEERVELRRDARLRGGGGGFDPRGAQKVIARRRRRATLLADAGAARWGPPRTSPRPPARRSPQRLWRRRPWRRASGPIFPRSTFLRRRPGPADSLSENVHVAPRGDGRDPPSTTAPARPNFERDVRSRGVRVPAASSRTSRETKPSFVGMPAASSVKGHVSARARGP